MDPPVPFLLKKLILKTYVTNDTMLTQNSSDDIKKMFSRTQNSAWIIRKNLILGRLNINSLRSKFETMNNIVEVTFGVF